MESTRRKILVTKLLILLSLLFLQGCGKNESIGTQENQVNLRNFGKNSVNLNITPDYVPDLLLMEMTDSLFYFGQEIVEEQEEEKEERSLYRYGFYYQALDGVGEPTCVTEIEAEWVLALHLSKDDAGEDILCVLSRVADTCILTEYSRSGEVLKSFTIEEEGFVRAHTTEIMRCPDGKYIAYSGQMLYTLKEDGSILSSIECPGASFRSGVVLKNGTVFITYFAEESPESYLCKVDGKSGTLSEAVLIPENSGLICEEEGNLLILDDATVYTFDIASQKAEKILEMNVYNIFPHRVYEMKTVGDAIHMLSWDGGNGGAPVKLEILTPKTEEQLAQELEEIERNPEKAKYDEDGKRIITLYDPYGMCTEMLVEDFNLNNDKYTVVVESGNYNYETVLVGQNSPDLMITLMGYQVEDFQNSGYLEDLMPFIEQSEILSMEELQEGIVKCFTFDGGLYALPQYASVETLMCLESQVDGKSGWTVDEFLTWLEEHPDAKGEMGLSKGTILQYCLSGNLEQYVNFEKGVADFENQDFRNMLDKINALNCDTNYYSYFISGECETTGTHLFSSYVSRVRLIAERELIFDEKLVNMGFPSKSGEPRMLINCTLNISILSRSTCKEGAFAFIEHYLTYDYEARAHEPQYERVLWTLKSRWVKECENSEVYSVPMGVDENGVITTIDFPITEDQEELLQSMLANAQPRTYEMQMILDIIAEEVQPYFQGQKDLDSVCTIIQSRVNILLSERR